MPAEWYSDPAVFERERRAVWSGEWIAFAPAARLSRPGQYVAEEVAGFPVFVVVDPDGSLRGFHNMCPHRAGVIVWPGQGTAGNLVCRYHGWAFGWDGALRSARDFGDDPGLCPAEFALAPIHVEQWRGLVFVHLGADPTPLAESIAPFAAECDPYPMESFTYVDRMVRVLSCNWKTYADNYLEGYHVPLIHPTLTRALDMATYRVDVPHESYCIHRSDTTDGSPAGGAWLFRYPNLAVNIYPDAMNVERIVPVSPTTCHVVYDYFARDPDDVDAMVKLSNEVLDEDQAMCEAVQRNLQAGVYGLGRLSPRHEQSLSWFQGRITRALGSEPS